MTRYLIYKTATGEIVRRYTGANPAPQCKPSESYLRVDTDYSDAECIIDITDPEAPVPALKSACPGALDAATVEADGLATIHLTGLKNDTRVRVEGMGTINDVMADQDDDVIALTFNMAGAYTLTLTHPLHLTAVHNIEATA